MVITAAYCITNYSKFLSDLIQNSLIKLLLHCVLVYKKFDADDLHPLKFVLDSDGCEVDPEDFEYVLQPDAAIMVLKPNELWVEV